LKVALSNDLFFSNPLKFMITVLTPFPFPTSLATTTETIFDEDHVNEWWTAEGPGN
jgi:hypothetical protein